MTYDEVWKIIDSPKLSNEAFAPLLEFQGNYVCAISTPAPTKYCRRYCFYMCGELMERYIRFVNVYMKSMGMDVIIEKKSGTVQLILNGSDKIILKSDKWV